MDRIAIDEGHLEQGEERAVREQAVLDGRRLAILDDDGVDTLDVDRLLDLREILLERSARGDARHLQLHLLAAFLGGVVEILQFINAVGIGQPAVIAEFVADKAEDQQARRDAEREAGDVDRGIGPVLGESADADGHVIAPHGWSPRIAGVRRRGAVAAGCGRRAC